MLCQLIASDATALPLPSAWQVPMDSGGGLDDEPVKPRSSYKSPTTSGVRGHGARLSSRPAIHPLWKGCWGMKLGGKGGRLRQS